MQENRNGCLAVREYLTSFPCEDLFCFFASSVPLCFVFSSEDMSLVSAPGNVV